jgi:hypothetical protein
MLRVGTVHRPAPQRVILVNIETGQATVLKTDLSETVCIMGAGLGGYNLVTTYDEGDRRGTYQPKALGARGGQALTMRMAECGRRSSSPAGRQSLRAGGGVDGKAFPTDEWCHKLI